MKCPNCKREIEDGWKICPYCSQPVNSYDDDDPKLGIFMKLFLVFGTVLLGLFGFWYFGIHQTDPHYRTTIEPDSTLADKDLIRFDTIKVDTTSEKETKKEEKEQAQKVFDSFRKNKPAEEKAPVVENEEAEMPAVTDAPAATEVPAEPKIAEPMNKPEVETLD